MNTDKIFAEAIANEYAPKKTSKVVALKKLDRKAKNPANIFAYSFGVIMSLVLGTGMCLSMKVIGSGTAAMFVLGVIIGIIGYFTIPTVAGWIIQAGGMGSYGRNVNQTAGRAGSMAGSVAGAAAGNMVGRAGKLLK